MDLTELKRSSVRGGFITMLSQGISITIQIASTVVLARLLTPDDYGVVAMVMAVTGFVGLFRDMGLSSAAIQKKDLTHAQLSNLYWMNIAAGTILTTALILASPLVVRFYGKPELQAVTIALSFSFIIGSIGAISNTLLLRKLQFGRQMLVNLSGSFVTLIVSLFLALEGYSYWSLVWGSLIGGVFGTVLLLFISPFLPGGVSRGVGMRNMIHFGASVTTFSLVNYFHRNLDNILIGRTWGPGLLGIYSRAYSLLMLPINSLRSPIETVAYPALSILQDKPNQFRNYFNKTIRLLALVSMPLTALLFCASKPLILILLGAEWSGVTEIFSVLSLAAFIQPVMSLWGIVLLSLGFSRRYLWIGIYTAATCSAGFLTGLPWGPIGVASAYVIVTYLNCIPVLIFAYRKTPIRISDIFSNIHRPFAASIVSTCVTTFLSIRFPDQSPVMELIFVGLCFSAIYCGILLTNSAGRSDIQLIYGLVSGHLRGRAPKLSALSA